MAEVGQGEHRQGDMGVPGSIAADLVAVEAGFVLGLLERFFHMPTGSRGPGEVDQAGLFGPVTELVGDLVLAFVVWGQCAACQQPVPPAPGPDPVDGPACAVVFAWSVGSGADGQPLPRRGGQFGDQHIVVGSSQRVTIT